VKIEKKSTFEAYDNKHVVGYKKKDKKKGAKKSSKK